MTGERGSDGVTRQSKSEGDRNHTQREADGYKWTKSHGEREEGGREGETEEVGVGREQKSGVTGGHRTPPSHSWDHRALQGLLPSHSPALEWGPSLGQ